MSPASRLRLWGPIVNRPYRNVEDSVLVECPQCRGFVLYTTAAIDFHETECHYDANGCAIDEVYTPVPPPTPIRPGE